MFILCHYAFCLSLDGTIHKFIVVSITYEIEVVVHFDMQSVSSVKYGRNNISGYIARPSL